MPETDQPPTGSPAVGAPLTPAEAGVLEYLVTYLGRHMFQPSVREIREACRHKSTRTTTELLRSLQSKGYVELPERGRARGVRIVGLQIALTRTLLPPEPEHRPRRRTKRR